ncbi:hypothetical protein SG34_008730 [Thalassomonas viridans]|uniref:Uncharacterized protein n=1 Tax=Thalassomonas viridans TaxID=137584 RepID=A0AAE9Z571_9GAMM|nr:hypothetical protein [Thalassomonas viridans]WDE06956.1 hypothetical protein SG34_008730 [Thalassomonas viridans]
MQELKSNFKFSEQVELSLRELRQAKPGTLVKYQSAAISKRLKELDTHDQETLKKVIILSCILENWPDFTLANYSQSVLDEYEKVFNNILANCESDAGWSKKKIDVYWKELAMVRQIMFPAGLLISERYSGFSSKQAIHLNRLTTLSFLKFLALHKGNKGYYEIHLYAPEMRQFNEPGWNESYVRLAEMMKSHPEVKGMFGISWFYDPQLRDISPRLMYLQDVPLKNGARSFYLGDDDTGNALSKSKSRMQLYQEGKYTPKSYLLIWPRKDMIAWADQYQKSYLINARQQTAEPG